MALVKGQCTTDPVTGMAGRIFFYIQSVGTTTLGMSASALTQGTPARNALAALIECIVNGVVDEILLNGEAYITTLKGALQQSGGVDTTPPSAERSLPLR